ncbi:FecR family protein [Echinicola salinicaeni]|uniref:FecR family protein n=1 Tax=Echinicola salinicaeni TaxID=2762757 RepID=UPI001649561E|nr:FecR family protein [Echinicola salinicaeni]
MSRELLNKFFKGDCSPEEVHKILVWINSETGKQDLDRAFEAFTSDHEGDNKVDSAEMLLKIKSRIEKEDKLKELAEYTNNRSVRTNSWLLKAVKVAASIVLIAFFTFVWYNNSQVEESVLIKDDSLVTKQTKLGQKLKIVLSDGSSVHLNAGSKISFPKKFSGDMRVVHLEGEAFFDVYRDPEHPFVVQSANMITKVLGTSFLVRDIPKEGNTKVAVLTGKVLVSDELNDLGDQKDNHTLLPMESVEFSTVSNKWELSKVNYDEVFAWKDNIIYFNSSNLHEVINVLERWYGCEFKVRKDFSSRKDFTGKFENQSLDNVLEGLSVTFDFKYKIQKKQITIY